MKKAPRKKTYLFFRRFLSGVITVCVLVTIVGSLLADATFPTVTLRALVVWAAISLIGSILVKTWAAWEITNAKESKTVQ